MSISITVFDPTTQNRRTILAEMTASIIIEDIDATYDYFIKLSTTAKTKAGNAITPRHIRSLSDGAANGGTTKHDGSGLPYTNMTEAINDHIWDMIDGTGGLTAMSFTL